MWKDSLTEAFVEKTLKVVIAWGRYAEIFSYDDHTETFSLEDVEGSL
ncbi:AAA-associated domain-containing protein [Pseudomonas sp. LF-5]